MKKYFVHKKGICESKTIGDGTKIWAFTHILPGAKIGKDCNICDHVFIENDVIIGNRVTIKSGVQIWDGIRIGNDVFIGPNVTFTNDKFPRSKQVPEKYLETIVEDGASIGANATILPGVRIGSNSMIGAGSVVTNNVPPNTIVVGNPARICGYAHKVKKSKLYNVSDYLEQNIKEPVAIGVGGCKIWPLKRFEDLRGRLLPIEFENDLPFCPKRQFFVFGVQSHNIRGEHAHKNCEQFLLSISGSLSVVVDDGKNSCEINLDKPEIGLYVPARIWSVQYKFSHDAVLVVYASDKYDPDDYIRTYEEFLNEFVSKTKGSDLHSSLKKSL
ncbi:MAG: WxcM-like domain-containing protein [Candidatus Anstonellales archaeon]